MMVVWGIAAQCNFAPAGCRGTVPVIDEATLRRMLEETAGVE